MASTEKLKGKQMKSDFLEKFWVNNIVFPFVLIYLFFNPEKVGGHGSEHKHAEKHHVVSIWFYIKLAVGSAIFIFSVIFFYFNPDQIDKVIFFLNIVQITFILVIFFMTIKLRRYMKEFSKVGSEIVRDYESNLKHRHHDEHGGHSLLENKYNLSIQQLNSDVDNEWKSGLVDLDNYIRLVLLDKNYTGDTTLELLNDAKLKGHQHVEEAENIAFLRQRLKTKGIHFDFSKKDLDILVKKFDNFKRTLSDNH